MQFILSTSSKISDYLSQVANTFSDAFLMTKCYLDIDSHTLHYHNDYETVEMRPLHLSYYTYHYIISYYY